MAVESPKVTSIIVEANEYPDLVRRYRVSGVPMTVVNGKVEILGARPEEDFVRAAVGAIAVP
jgi:predicted DsbA family dithiol-disulfide isomerase